MIGSCKCSPFDSVRLKCLVSHPGGDVKLMISGVKDFVGNQRV